MRLRPVVQKLRSRARIQREAYRNELDEPALAVTDTFAVVRCLAEQDQCWRASSLELGLTVTADTFPQARLNLQAAIASYVYAACKEGDAAMRRRLKRRAGIRIHARYVIYYGSEKHAWLDRIARAMGGSAERVLYLECLALDRSMLGT